METHLSTLVDMDLLRSLPRSVLEQCKREKGAVPYVDLLDWDRLRKERNSHLYQHPIPWGNHSFQPNLKIGSRKRKRNNTEENVIKKLKVEDCPSHSSSRSSNYNNEVIPFRGQLSENNGTEIASENSPPIDSLFIVFAALVLLRNCNRIQNN